MTFSQLQRRNIRKPKKIFSRRRDLEGSPQKKGTCLKVFTTTPRKPNSAIRKVARIFLSNRRVITGYIEGEGHNLQKHANVLVRGGRAKDVPGVRYTTIRGKFDLQPLVLIQNGRSLYGVKLPKASEHRKNYYSVKIHG